MPCWPRCHLPNWAVAYPARLSDWARVTFSSGSDSTLSTGRSGRSFHSNRSIPADGVILVRGPYWLLIMPRPRVGWQFGPHV